MYCRNCGSEINENQKFCSKCGTEISIDGLHNVNKLLNNFNNKSSKTQLVIGIILLCTSLGFLLFFLIAYGSFVEDGLLPSSLFFILLFITGCILLGRYIISTGNNKKDLLTNFTSETQKEILDNNKNSRNIEEKEKNSKSSVINIILNVFWAILGGLIYAFGWIIVGALWCITLIGIPLGLQYFKLAKLMLMPFGATIVDKK